MFHPGMGGRGQMMPRFASPEMNRMPMGSFTRPFFPRGPPNNQWGCPVERPNNHWGCPVDRPRVPFPPGFHPHGRPPFYNQGPSPRHFQTRGQTNEVRNKRPWDGPQGNKFNKKKKNQQPAVDKRDLPENNKYFCDICERGFKNEKLYTEHTNAHEKCKVDGCSFTAAPKLVQLHYKLQHKTGLAKKIWSLESQEDLDKWRADRKRNFPTSANIAKKERTETEKVARGEILKTETFGKFKDRKGGRGRGRFAGHHRGNKQHSQNAPVNNGKQPKDDKQQKKNKETLGSKPTEKDDTSVDPLSFLLNEASPGSDEDPVTMATVDQEDKSLLTTGVLGQLMSVYASDSDPDVKEEPVQKDLSKTNQGPEILDKTSGKKRNRKRKGTHHNGTSSHQVNKSTLLQKLLAPEVRHERNVLLQCIRYIVKENFFSKTNPVPEHDTIKTGDSIQTVTPQTNLVPDQNTIKTGDLIQTVTPQTNLVPDQNTIKTGDSIQTMTSQTNLVPDQNTIKTGDSIQTVTPQTNLVPDQNTIKTGDSIQTVTSQTNLVPDQNTIKTGDSIQTVTSPSNLVPDQNTIKTGDSIQTMTSPSNLVPDQNTIKTGDSIQTVTPQTNLIPDQNTIKTGDSIQTVTPQTNLVTEKCNITEESSQTVYEINKVPEQSDSLKTDDSSQSVPPPFDDEIWENCPSQETFMS